MSRPSVGLDHSEDLARGVVFDAEHPLLAAVPISVMWTVTSENSRSHRTHGRFRPCLFGFLGHVLVLLVDYVDRVVVDGDLVADSKQFGEDRRPLSVPFVELEDPDVEVLRVVSVGLWTRYLQLGDLVGFSVRLRELLNPTPADVELVVDERRIQLVVNNALTDSFDIVLLQLHLVVMIEGEIMPTKTFPDTTPGKLPHL